MKNPGIYPLAILVIIVIISTASCNQTAATPTPTITPTPTPTPTPTLQPGQHTRFVTVNGYERSYIIYLPHDLDRLQPAPVVFAFHGFGDDNLLMQSSTEFNPIADQNGFLIAYPQGIDSSWNIGECCATPQENNVDEAAFVRQILSDLGTISSIDPKRIYATGKSLGGMLSYRLACEMSDTFAAIAPVAGVLWYSPCQPGEPVSVMHVHGMDDTIVPYDGGGFFPPVEPGIDTWVQLDGCSGSPREEKDGPVTRISYESCQAGTTIELYKIDGVGHDWPMTAEFSTSQKIWEFFAAHPKP